MTVVAPPRPWQSSKVLRHESKVNLELLELMLSNPECSYAHAGEYFGVTRERIRQIMMENFVDVYEGREAYAIWKREQRIEKINIDRASRMETVSCPVCLKDFTRTKNSSRPRRYCSTDCRRLFNTYFRYYLRFDQHQKANAETTLNRIEKEPYLLEDCNWRARYNWAERTLDEFEENGFIARKRTIRRNPPKSALILAKKIGIDLDETLARLLEEENISLAPGEQGP